ncbi:hypothetical protein [Haloarcula halophila]|uniref:hypothetical protein n=1 Tax=Haloarcula TaxID=2237 RepID=UPI0023E447DB|nr:hypothetical protein [Halomicroarcula sp. DFY41]
MTQHTTSETDSRIDRRTALGLIGGGLTAFAGCGGVVSTNENSTATTSPTPTPATDNTPIESIEYTVKEVSGRPQIFASVTVTDSVEITQIRLVANDRVFHRNAVDEGTADIPLTYAAIDKHYPPEGGKLVLISEDEEREVSFPYRPDIRLKEVIRASNSSRLESDSQLEPIGIVLENHGNKPGLANSIDYEGAPANAGRPDSGSSRGFDNRWGMIRGGDELLLKIHSFFYEEFDCSDFGTRDATIRVALEFAEDIVAKVPVTYEHEGGRNCTQTLGTARNVGPATDTPETTQE